MEKWASIPDFEAYEASSLGRIRTIKTQRIRRTQFLTGGYEYITLWNGEKRHNRRLHRVVWEAFHGKIPAGLTVNHKDCNNQNNRLDNLELLSRLENDLHAIRNGRNIQRHKLTPQEIAKIKLLGGTCREIAARFSINPTTVSRIKRNWR